MAENSNSGPPRANPASSQTGLELGATELVQRSDHLTTLPPNVLANALRFPLSSFLSCRRLNLCRKLRGCLHDTGATFAPRRVHSGSLSWLYICLHDTTTKCHAGASRPGVSSLRLSHRGEISLRCEISQRYHVNAKRPPVPVGNQSAGRLERVAHA